MSLGRNRANSSNNQLRNVDVVKRNDEPVSQKRIFFFQFNIGENILYNNMKKNCCTKETTDYVKGEIQ